MTSQPLDRYQKLNTPQRRYLSRWTGPLTTNSRSLQHKLRFKELLKKLWVRLNRPKPEPSAQTRNNSPEFGSTWMDTAVEFYWKSAFPKDEKNIVADPNRNKPTAGRFRSTVGSVEHQTVVMVAKSGGKTPQSYRWKPNRVHGRRRVNLRKRRRDRPDVYKSYLHNKRLKLGVAAKTSLTPLISTVVFSFVSLFLHGYCLNSTWIK